MDQSGAGQKLLKASELRSSEAGSNLLKQTAAVRESGSAKVEKRKAWRR